VTIGLVITSLTADVHGDPGDAGDSAMSDPQALSGAGCGWTSKTEQAA